jgi:choline dehydrogenase-like flavoprotein
MDHFTGSGAVADFSGMEDHYYYGRKPGNIYMPRFRNINAESLRTDYLRGWGVQGSGSRKNWEQVASETKGFGKEFKEKLLAPGPWTLWLGGWGETLPYYRNRISLDDKKTDQWGLPLVHIHFSYGDNEKKMRQDIRQTCAGMLEKTGFHNVTDFDYDQPPGSAIHEMGTLRMGNDPKTSVLNGNNQVHAVKNLFVTDGSCMASSAWQNPSLTYMALTARACDFAVNELKRGNL